MTTEDQVLALIEEGNPIPDPDALSMDQHDSTVYLTTLTRRSREVTQLETNPEESKQRKRTPWIWLAAAVVIAGISLVVLSQVSEDATPATGPVAMTFETIVDLSARPETGVFEVTEGAEALGCSAGTNVYTFDGATRNATMDATCTEGGTGTFELYIDQGGVVLAREGTWSVLAGTGDFVGLQGGGDYVLETDGTPTSYETFTGTIEYTP
ncbi:MAG: hypothetical protein ACR2N7_02730 [Acidimicrobiia bacterium]